MPTGTFADPSLSPMREIKTSGSAKCRQQPQHSRAELAEPSGEGLQWSDGRRNRTRRDQKPRESFQGSEDGTDVRLPPGEEAVVDGLHESQDHPAAIRSGDQITLGTVNRTKRRR